MRYTTEFTLPFGLGHPTAECEKDCYDYFYNDKTFGRDLEGFIDVRDRDPENEGVKIVAMVRDGLCVTATVPLDDPEADSFCGQPLIPLSGESYRDAQSRLIADLEKQGIRTQRQFNGIALLDHFVIVDIRDSITWWDPTYWGHDGFTENAVALYPIED